MAFSVKIFLLIVLFALLSSKHIYARDSRFFSKMPRSSNDNSKTLEEEEKEIEKQVLGSPYREKDMNIILKNSKNLEEEAKQVLGPLYREKDINVIPDNSKTLEEEAKEIEKQVLGPLYREKDMNVIFENSKSLQEEAKEIEKQVLGPLYEENDMNIIPENEIDHPFGLDSERNEKFASFDNEIVNTDIDKIVDKIDEKSYSFDDEKFNDDTRPYLPNNYNVESYVTDSQGYHRNTGKDGYKYATKAEEDSKGMGKQGMSDTKFLEDGKYFYDINLEKNGGNNNGRFFGYKNNGGYFYNQQDIPKDDIPNEYKIQATISGF